MTTLNLPSYLPRSYRPYSLHLQSLNYDEIRALRPLDRLNKAFDVAEKSFGAPKLLNPTLASPAAAPVPHTAFHPLLLLHYSTIATY